MVTFDRQYTPEDALPQALAPEERAAVLDPISVTY
jgi:hypothetical protein